MLRRRKAQREAQRKKAAQQRKKMRLQLCAVAAVIVAAVGLIWSFSHGSAGQEPTPPGQTVGRPQPGTQPPTQPAPSTEPATKATEPPVEEKFTTIHIAAAGDLNVTDQVVELGHGPNGYDYTAAFQDVAPVLGEADLTLLNLEGTLSGAPYGGERSSAPNQLAKALKDIGVDAVQTANSASIRGGVLGLQATIENLYAAGLAPIGTFYDSDAFRESGGYTMLEVQGLRIAVIGFTKGMDNLGLPQGSEDCVNVLYEDYFTDYSKVDTKAIKKVLKNVEEEQADLTIAMVHWGSEYMEELSRSQKKIRDLLLDGGVDVILGTHSHLVQAVEFDEAANTLVAYSLGDFYGDADQPGTNYSLILDIEVTRENRTGETRITGYSYTPIYTVRPEDSAEGGLRVVQLEKAMERYEAGYLGRVNESTYDAMAYGRKRLEERLGQNMK